MKKLNLAIFISGRGSNMLSIAAACRNPDYPAKISLVLSNKPKALGIDAAKKLGIPTEIVDNTLYNSRGEFDNEIQNRLGKYEIDLIVLAGFMRVLTPEFVNKWPDSIINIHPSLLPDYKGTNTHERAINDGKKEAGCTVHYVIPALDSGPIIAQKSVPVLQEDTPDTLEKRVLEQEHILYPEAIRLLASSLN